MHAQIGKTAVRRRDRNRRWSRKNQQLPPDGKCRGRSADRIVSGLDCEYAVHRRRRFRCGSFHRCSIATRPAGTSFGIHVDNCRARRPFDRLADPHRSFGRRCFCPNRTNTTAANWSSRTLWVPGRSSCRRAISSSILRSSLHMVTPVTRGNAGRILFLAAEHDPDPHARSMIFDLDVCDPASCRTSRARTIRRRSS